ncbi:hypothetical protein M9H77_04649 [Catharanthus roseus]|uniref:Uncharacterized protein n=1 Tax=Catharanthus roseus TaxID=4058 RepID=A0ACC0CEQ3_CATRO|nr:hypothetical protein M9H77_04649 [Catharanthus roseus]
MLNCKRHLSKSPHAYPDKNWIGIVNIVAATIKPYWRFNHGHVDVPTQLGCGGVSGIKPKVNVGASLDGLSKRSCGIYDLESALSRSPGPSPLRSP